MRRALAYLAIALFSELPLAIGAQAAIPDALKDKALVVKITAIVPIAQAGDSSAQASSKGSGSDKSQSPPQPQDWVAESVKYTVPGTPVPFKLVGSNVAIIVQVTPFEDDNGKGVTLVAQGQVWVKPPEGGLSYHTNIDTLSVNYGESVLYYPLGLGPEGKAPIKLEISVVRSADMNQDGSWPGDKAGK